MTDALCDCGRPSDHRGMCAARWATRNARQLSGSPVYYAGPDADPRRRELFLLLSVERAYQDLAATPLAATDELLWQRNKVKQRRLRYRDAMQEGWR